MTKQDLMTLLSQNIKKFRALRGMSQTEFAEKVDISVPFLSTIESGKKWVSPATMTKLADGLGIQVHELLKPETALPDAAADVLEKYTADIFGAIGETLDGMRESYIRQLDERKDAR